MSKDCSDSQILYLTYDGLTDPLGQAQILPYLRGLAFKGYKISIVSFEKSENAHLRSAMHAACVKYGIVWYPLVYHKRPRILSTIFDLWRAWKRTSALIEKHHIQIVHCRSYLMAMIGLRAKKRYQVPFIFDMRGFWIDERFDGGLWNLKNPIDRLMYQFFKKKELHFLRQADQVVCLTSKAAQIVTRWGARGTVTVIPCCVDEKLFTVTGIDNKRQTKLVETLGLEGKFVLLYLGSVGTWYMLHEMLDFFKVARRRLPNAMFLIVSNDPTTIAPIIKSKGVDLHDVVITKSMRCDVPLFLSISQFSIFFIKPKFSKQGSSPTKLAESLSMNVPIIANAGVGDIDEMFSENNFGILIRDFTEKEYEHAVDCMIRYEKATNLSELAEEKFSLRSGVALYEKIYRSLLYNEAHKDTSLDYDTPQK